MLFTQHFNGMNVEEIRDYCLSKPGATESLPFDDETLVLKVGGRIFAMISLSGDSSLTLKCDPEIALELQEKYTFVEPGYHMNKKFWITLRDTTLIPRNLVMQWIDSSFVLVAAGKK